MIVDRPVNPCEVIVNRLASFRTTALESVRDSKPALVAGLGLSLLAGAPTPFAQLAFTGPALATLAAGALGGRAAAAVGYVAFLALARPSAGMAVVAAAVALLVGWLVPLLLDREPEEEVEASGSAASAIVVDCDGFSSLDDLYGAGTSEHVFNLLHKALRVETRSTDVVVHAQGQELILVLDGSTPAIAQSVMARVERRFSGWLADAGYDCNLSVGLCGGVATEDDEDDLLRAARRAQNGPYMD